MIHLGFILVAVTLCFVCAHAKLGENTYHVKTAEIEAQTAWKSDLIDLHTLTSKDVKSQLNLAVNDAYFNLTSIALEIETSLSEYRTTVDSFVDDLDAQKAFVELYESDVTKSGIDLAHALYEIAFLLEEYPDAEQNVSIGKYLVHKDKDKQKEALEIISRFQGSHILELLQKASDLGNSAAQHRLASAHATGILHAHAHVPGGLVPMDAGKALFLDYMAALSGEPEAHLSMGYELSRADVARMRHTRLSSTAQGGGINTFTLSHSVSLSALTYALSPTPISHTSHHTSSITHTGTDTLTG